LLSVYFSLSLVAMVPTCTDFVLPVYNEQRKKWKYGGTDVN
jgi:peroxiredoxin